MYAWDHNALLEVLEMAKSDFESANSDRDEGLGRTSSMEHVPVPSSDIVIFANDEEHIGSQIDVISLEQSETVSDPTAYVMNHFEACARQMRNIHDEPVI